MRRTLQCVGKLLSPERRCAAKRTSRCDELSWFCRIDFGLPSAVPSVWSAKTAPPNAGQRRWRTLRSTSSGSGYGSWPGATCAGVGDWFAGACESRVGASTTSGCNGSGARRGSRGPCHASRSANNPQTAPESYSEPNTRNTRGPSTFSSTRPVTARKDDVSAADQAAMANVAG